MAWAGYRSRLASGAVCIVFAVAVLPFLGPTSAAGDCFSDGRYFANGSTWQTLPCLQCACHSSVVFCEAVHCQNPHCDLAKGQQLQQVKGQCCPACLDIGRPCTVQGHLVQDKARWTPSPCATCSCEDGEVRCAMDVCETLACKPGQEPQSLPGQCCPRCLPTGQPCTDEEGQRRDNGAEWFPLPCVMCLCREGQTECFPRQCAPPACPWLADLAPPGPGQCCPQCRRSQCHSQGQTYQNGDRWSQENCTRCACYQGTVTCHTKTCADTPTCKQGEHSVQRAGQCCPLCVSDSGACEVNGTRRYHGDLWKVNDCNYCTCHHGNARCSRVVCPSANCKQGEKLQQTAGTCCKECSEPQVCHHGNQTVQDGFTWKVDACTVCTCKRREVLCYHKACPSCPRGQTRLPLLDHCCGTCQPDRCSPACATCLPDRPADHCLTCRGPNRVQQDGRCLEQCDQGSYPAANRVCLPCDQSCQTCDGGSRYDCLTCPASAWLQDGQCVDHCGAGYFPLSPRCQACHDTCGTCSGPGDWQCLSCLRSGQLLHAGVCRDTCPPRHFLSGAQCLACPPTCKTCALDGQDCVSCYADAVLYQGNCLSECPQGYFTNKDNICEECHPSCGACERGLSTACTSCKPGTVQSPNGLCLSTCPSGQRATLDSRCLACGKGCEECTPSRDGVTSACIRCSTPSQVAVGPTCHDSCQPATYLRDGFCFVCDAKCEVCEGPGRCTRCFPHVYLADGQCVHTCPDNRFIDQDSSCQPCPAHCLSCLSNSVCLSCDQTTFLWRGLCLQTCAEGLTVDVEERICYENVHPPSVTITGPLLVPHGQGAPLTADHIRVSDPDTPGHGLTLTLSALPDNGQLVLTSRQGEAVALRAGDTVTGQDLARNRLRFVHTRGAGSHGQIAFKVSDGILTTGTNILPVRVQPDLPLSVKVQKSMVVTEGGHSVLSRDVLDVTSGIADEEVLFLLVDGPKRGDFVKRAESEVVRSFTLSDARSGDIVYQHRPSGIAAGSSDMAVLVVSDGIHQLTLLLTIELRSRNHRLPVVVTNNDGLVMPGGLLHISNDLLEVRIFGQPSDRVVFTLVPTLNNPENGELLMMAPIPGEGPPRGWEDLGDSTMVTKAVQFLQRDIEEGRIYYRHRTTSSSADLADNFTFDVSDRSQPANVLRNQSYIIRVISEVQEDSRQFAHPTHSLLARPDKTPQNAEFPVMTVAVLRVKEGRAVTVTNASIQVQDLDTLPQQLVLTLLLSPSAGSLKQKKVNLDADIFAEPLEVNSSFTYEDILQGRIIYHHDDSDVTADHLLLGVSDGDFSDVKQLSIIIDLVNDETPTVSVNTGLFVKAGTKTTIRSSDLAAVDMDSDGNSIQYTLKKNPTAGQLLFHAKDGRKLALTVQGPRNTFTQEDIDNGRIEYAHEKGELTGNLLFKFALSDPEGNELIDQDFFITVIEDRTPPVQLAIEELVVREGSREKITTQFLSFTDRDSDPASLLYQVFEGPQLGHLELLDKPGSPLTDFTQADLAAGNVMYAHTSSAEVYTDQFLFSVTDGSNEVIRTFHIRLTPVDDALPLVTNNGLAVPEGGRKTITVFDLKAVDLDTREESVVFAVIQPPLHGALELAVPGVHEGSQSQDVSQGQSHDLRDSQSHFVPVSRFTMQDVAEGRLSYRHGDGEGQADSFAFVVSDGTNSRFHVQRDDAARSSQRTPLTSPQEFKISVLPVDDSLPVIQVNTGLDFLETWDSKIGNYITRRELMAVDEDTPARGIVYSVTTLPQHGQLDLTDWPGHPVTTFTQEDINKGLVRYLMTSPARPQVEAELQDQFWFELKDARPNVVKGNLFHIRWSQVYLAMPVLSVSETAGVLQVPIIRRGHLRQYAVVQCQTRAGTAESLASSLHSRLAGSPHTRLADFEPFIGQVQFEEGQDRKTCPIVINDDSFYEGPEVFYVELTSPTYAVLGNVTRAAITIVDDEDVTSVQFAQEMISVNETDAEVVAVVTRTGDVSGATSVICSTSSVTATGSSLSGLESGCDFISRGATTDFRVTFPVGVNKTFCAVKLIDDSEYELEERFELQLSAPSALAVLGNRRSAAVVIEGPNDESELLLPGQDYHFPENAGTVEVAILRRGSDLRHPTTVWCATRASYPPSATPGADFTLSSSLVTFLPGQTSQICHLTLLDDDFDPRVEGNETFDVILHSPVGSRLAKPFIATVTISDQDLDMPTFTFQQDGYTVDEYNATVSATILRTGDATDKAYVICYTRQLTATVNVDYLERILANQSIIFFEPGQREKNCSVTIVDDEELETEEEFQLLLANASTEEGSRLGARLGDVTAIIITITNHDDIPMIQLERSAYSVHEPSVKEQIITLVVRLQRTGAVNLTSSVRCSTRDGSAMSGLDYNAKSLRITFGPGDRSVDFPVDILYNSDVEWHESFSVLLGPEDPDGATFGSVTMTTITIMDSEMSGSLVLPAAPVVVSLLHYDDADLGTKADPSPGYPLICINPCDMRYPMYAMTHKLCQESGINTSAILYQWEVATPSDPAGSRSPFVPVSDNTLFTSPTTKVLDSIYFRPHFRVRCTAQPLHPNGNPGVPLKSPAVTIGRKNGICNPPAFDGDMQGFHAQSFVASLNYVNASSDRQPNTIHIRVEIPHQDGLLPLVSTHPLNNIRFLLSEPIYRQQHVCSNIVTAAERAPLTDQGFIAELAEDNQLPYGPGFDFPYQLDRKIREGKTLTLYRHLDLKRCIWSFDAYYHMSDLVDICGGTVVSDFSVKDDAKTHLTVRVPLHVSYLLAAAPSGWTCLEQRTEMELAFYYSTVLWRSGLEAQGPREGKMQVRRILIGQDGKLLVEFRTQAKFRGQYVLTHPTAPGMTSRFVAPRSVAVSFDLELTWSQSTFDGPHQTWLASSRFNLKGDKCDKLSRPSPQKSWLCYGRRKGPIERYKDYTGVYNIELIPCVVTPAQAYVSNDPLPCTAGQPQRFEMALSVQQTHRPVPVVYSLDTHLQLTNSLHMLLTDTAADSTTQDDWNFSGTFSQGQYLYGKVMWNRQQDLKAAYRLTIMKVYLCTGNDGYIPTYDPAGEVYGEGPQYGCIQPSPKLLFRFLMLDRENSATVDRSFQDIPFKASFASDNEELSPILTLPGVDGFLLSIDPLYKVDSGHQWYLQVVYLIGPADTPIYRHRRDVASTQSLLSRSHSSSTPSVTVPLKKSPLQDGRNGTNMQKILLERPGLENESTGTELNLLYTILPLVLVAVCLASIIIIRVCIRKRRRKRSFDPSSAALVHQNNLASPALGVSVTSVKVLNQSVSSSSINRLSSSSVLKQHATVLPISKSNIKVNNLNTCTPKKKDGKFMGTEV